MRCHCRHYIVATINAVSFSTSLFLLLWLLSAQQGLFCNSEILHAALTTKKRVVLKKGGGGLPPSMLFQGTHFTNPPESEVLLFTLVLMVGRLTGLARVRLWEMRTNTNIKHF